MRAVQEKVQRERSHGETSHVYRVQFISQLFLKMLFQTVADGEGRVKSKKENSSKTKGKKKKKKGSDVEGHEDSDDGDFEGLEVDYMSEESR